MNMNALQEPSTPRRDVIQRVSSAGKVFYAMACPACNSPNQIVIDSRFMRQHGQRRRRKCEECGHRWTTYELPEKQFEPSIDEEAEALRHQIQQYDATVRMLCLMLRFESNGEDALKSAWLNIKERVLSDATPESSMTQGDSLSSGIRNAATATKTLP